MNPVRLVVLDASLHQIGAIRRPASEYGSFTTRRVRPAQPRVDRAAPARTGERAHASSCCGPDSPARLLETLVGRLYGLAPSPDGRTVLVGWGAADQWLLVPTRAGGRTRRVTGLAAVFGSSAVPVANAWAR